MLISPNKMVSLLRRCTFSMFFPSLLSSAKRRRPVDSTNKKRVTRFVGADLQPQDFQVFGFEVFPSLSLKQIIYKQVFRCLTFPFCPFDEADIRKCYRKNPALFGCKGSQIELEYPVYHVHCQVELRVTRSLQACYLLSVGRSIGKYADHLLAELGQGQAELRHYQSVE